MIYKEKLAGGGNKLEYTHTFTSTREYVPVDTYMYYLKTITPKDVNGYEITGLFLSEPSSTFGIELKDSVKENAVYLGDYQSKEVAKLNYVNTYPDGCQYESTYEQWVNCRNIISLIRRSVNSEQQIYISFTPPPPGLKASNCHLYREVA